MKNYLLAIACGVLCAFSSCSKGGDPVDGGTGGGGHVFTPTDIIAPDVTIFSPTPGQIFSNGTQISVMGKVTDDYGLYQGTIKITNDANGVSLVNQPYVIHGILSYNFSVFHTVNIAAAADYTVSISFEDHGANITTKTVKIRVTP